MHCWFAGYVTRHSWLDSGYTYWRQSLVPFLLLLARGNWTLFLWSLVSGSHLVCMCRLRSTWCWIFLETTSENVPSSSYACFDSGYKFMRQTTVAGFAGDDIYAVFPYLSSGPGCAASCAVWTRRTVTWRDVVVFPVVAQRQIPIVFGIPQLPYNWWSMSLLCSCSRFYRSLTCPSVCNDWGRSGSVWRILRRLRSCCSSKVVDIPVVPQSSSPWTC